MKGIKVDLEATDKEGILKELVDLLGEVIHKESLSILFISHDFGVISRMCDNVAVMHKGKAGEVYNIGGGNEITNMELTKDLLKLLGKSEECIEFVKDRPGHDKRYALDIAKIKALGWKPRHDFKGALELTVSWYSENKAWWKRLIKCRKDIKY